MLTLPPFQRNYNTLNYLIVTPDLNYVLILCKIYQEHSDTIHG
jgi:hypothetical protein